MEVKIPKLCIPKHHLTNEIWEFSSTRSNLYFDARSTPRWFAKLRERRILFKYLFVRKIYSVWVWSLNWQEVLKMKIILLGVFVAALVAFCSASTQPVIPNTRAEGCQDGVCGSHCALDGAKIFPSEQLNQPGKCRTLYCNSDFSIVVTPCPFDCKCFLTSIATSSLYFAFQILDSLST